MSEQRHGGARGYGGPAAGSGGNAAQHGGTCDGSATTGAGDPFAGAQIGLIWTLQPVLWWPITAFLVPLGGQGCAGCRGEGTVLIAKQQQPSLAGPGRN